MLVALLAAIIALIAGIVALIRRRRRSSTVPPQIAGLWRSIGEMIDAIINPR